MTKNQAWIAGRHRELLAIRLAMKRNQHSSVQLARSERAILNRITQLESKDRLDYWEKT